ncbi:hypothetical protein RHGRI_038116 [Rhododendron griersonianum]|uniref:BHLH domain-containing protein n=1 Tax=Rhododendron griersonianum TaxID=479676 RepID=A0AAV6HX86_9ERIC|nr:hypothetical protein RHGRI_038116 [Rhododendron griersonianum]KAG5517607.1 hypothetical protein RHGRI_038116 [Rhododendron griersonianum]
MDTNRQVPQYSHDTNQQQRQVPSSSGLMRYRSAPSSYFADLINSSGLRNDVVENCDEFLDPRQTSPETERILSRLMSGGGGTGQNASVNEALQSQFPTESAKHGGAEIFGHSDQHRQQQQNSNYSSGSNIMYHNSVASNSGIESTYRMESLPQMKIGGGGGGGNSNLIRHSSSPAGLFSNINIENVSSFKWFCGVNIEIIQRLAGYGVMRGLRNFGGGNGTNAEASFPSPSRLDGKSQIDFSSAPSSSLGRMTPILENRSKSMEITGFPIGSWDDSAIISDRFLKGIEEDEDRKTFSAMNNASENQNAEGGMRPPHVLSHHLSLPTSSAELSAMENLLQFQDSVPCRIRAKRGFATHPRSIAERVRRTRISERMRKLQELVPNMDKILSDTQAKCKCSNKQRP